MKKSETVILLIVAMIVAGFVGFCGGLYVGFKKNVEEYACPGCPECPELTPNQCLYLFEMERSVYYCDCGPGGGVSLDVIGHYPTWIDWDWPDAVRHWEGRGYTDCECQLWETTEIDRPTYSPPGG